MSEEHHQITVTRYRDPAGNPTCAADFTSDPLKVCMFYRTQRFGCSETCVFAREVGHKGYTEMLGRRKKGMGSLIPLDNCPVWANGVN